MNIKKLLSGCLNILLAFIFIISANIALANPDLTKSENYFPGGKYDLFNGGRFARQGSKIVDVNNNIRVSGPSFQAGSVLIHLQQYSGEIEFERSFENHPLSVHGSWRRTNSEQLPFFHGNISSKSLGIGVSRGTIYGVEIHPEDAYDAKDGGDHPYDIYNYRVSGSSITTSINPPNLPTLLPTPLISPNQNNDNQDNKTENNDNRREDQIRQENADSQGENDAVTENGELTPQQDTYYDDTCIGCDADPNGYNYDGAPSYNVGCFDTYCANRANGRNAEVWAELEGESAKNSARNLGRKAAENATKAAKDAKKIESNNKANDFARDKGYANAHDLKENYVGKNNVAKYDIYINNKTGESFLINKNGSTIIKID